MSGEWGKPSIDKLRVPVTLKIPTEGGWIIKTVQAIQVGDLAVHESLNKDKFNLGYNLADDKIYKWQVTHVPTLTMFDKAIPEGDWTQEQLLKWCWKVQDTERIYFKELARFNNQNYQQINPELLEKTCNYCLSIGVE